MFIPETAPASKALSLMNEKKINLPICFVFKAKYYKGHNTHWCWIIIKRFLTH